MTETSGARCVITFYDEYGKEICQVPCAKNDIEHTVRGVQDNLWVQSRRNAARWEVRDL